MAVRNKAQFKALYGTSGTLFPDNTTGDIGADDVRAQSEDLTDSFLNKSDEQYTGIKGISPGLSSTSANAITTIKAVATVNLAVGVFIIQRITNASENIRIYELIASTAADNGITTIRPDDYAGTTNEKVWRKGNTIVDDYSVPNLSSVVAVGASAGGVTLTNLGAPSSGNDAATKTYVDTTFGGTGGLSFTTIDIGDWDMDANNTVDVAHGLDWTKIRTISFVIRNDANSIGYVVGQSASGSNDSNLSVVSYDSTNITLTRLIGSFLDSTNFDSTSYNRGWITISYVS